MFPEIHVSTICFLKYKKIIKSKVHLMYNIYISFWVKPLDQFANPKLKENSVAFKIF